MYELRASFPIYDNRDGVCGRRSVLLTEYHYETEKLARYMLWKLFPRYDEEGNPLEDEVSYYIADTNDRYRRPIHPKVDFFDSFDDIPF